MGVADVSQVLPQDWQVGAGGAGGGVAPHQLLQLREVGGGQGALHPQQQLVEEPLEAVQEAGPVLLPRPRLQVLAPPLWVLQQLQHQLPEALLGLQHRPLLLPLAARGRLPLGEEAFDGVVDGGLGPRLLQQLHHHLRRDMAAI